MPLFSETQEKIFGDIISDVVENTNLSRTSPGSKVRSLVDTVSRKMGRQWRQFDLNVGQPFLDGANGKYLDFIGDMMGLPRLGEVPARISASDRNVKFYVDSGNFGNINAGSSIIIPSGTIISSQTGGEGIVYRALVSTLLAADESEGYVTVESVRTGSSVNLGTGQLTYHDFNDYADAASDTLKVTNSADIIQGQDIESDANYRFRITNQLLSLEAGNGTAIRIAALSVPGVADIVMSKYHRGIGTYDMMIKATTPTVPTELINAVQSAIDRVTSEGVYGTARAPKEIGVSLTATLTLKKKLSAQEETDLIESVTNNLREYINSLDIGEDLIINEMIERVMATSEVIKNVGEATKPFDSIFIYTPSVSEDNKIRATLITDYSPEVDERVIVENSYAGATPILVRIA